MTEAEDWDCTYTLKEAVSYQTIPITGDAELFGIK
jgi:hypothetical protein